MNCSIWEERIALYAGSDLTAAEASEVERHVGDCAGCQVLLSGLRESLELLRETHAEPVAEAHFAAVRARVLSELERESKPLWRRPWVYAMVAAAMLLLVAVRPKDPKEEKRIEVVQPAPVAPVAQVEAEPVPERPAQPPHRKRRPQPAPVAIAVKAEQPAEPLVVKLLTNDPDVIIYWITDTKGE